MASSSGGPAEEEGRYGTPDPSRKPPDYHDTRDILPTPWFPGPRDGASQAAVSTSRRETTFAANRDYRSIIYGQNRVGTSVFAVSNSASTGKLILGLAIGEGPINSIEDTHAFGGTGLPWLDLSTQYLGTASPSADSELQAALGSVEVYPFLAWVKAVYDTNLLSTAIEFPTLTVKGLKIYDPRENRLTYSDSGRSSLWTFSSAPTLTAIDNSRGYTGVQTSDAAADGAFQWAFGAGGPHSAYRSTSGLSAATTDPILVSCYMKVASGTADVNLKAIRVTGGETTTTVCSLTSTAWTRFEAIVTSGASVSEARIQIDGIPSSTSLGVQGITIQKLSEYAGYVKSTSAAVTQQIAYSANPALEMADLKTNTRYGQRMGPYATYSGSGVNDLHVFWSPSPGAVTPGTIDLDIQTAGPSPDQFQWRFNGGSYTTGVNATGANQVLTQGVNVRFGSIDGHDASDAWTIQIPSAHVDWASVGRAAEWCDEKMGTTGIARFECHLTLREPQTFDEWEKTIGLHFGGRWVFANGKYKLYVHRPTTTVAYAITTTHIVGSPTLSRGTPAGTLDQPNRLTVRWVDPADNYKEKPYTASSVAGDQDEIREGRAYSLPGCPNEDQARRTATYLLNGILADTKLELEGTLALCDLLPGDLVTVTDSTVGLSAAQFTVTSNRLSSDGLSVRLTATEYDPDIWSDTAGATDTAPTSQLISPFTTTPPEVTRPRQASTAYPPSLYWDLPRAYKADTLYGTSSWAQSGTSGYDGTKVNDGLTSATAFSNPTTGTGKYVRLDAGSAKNIVGCLVTLSQSGSTALTFDGSNVSSPGVSHSDNDSSYTAVTATCTAIVDSSGTVTALWLDWASPTSHRYWRLTLADTPAAQQDIKEVQFKELYADEWPYVKGWEVISGLTTSSPVKQFVPKSLAPSSTRRVVVLEGAIATVSDPYIVHQSDIIVRTVGYGGKSSGRFLRVQSLSDAYDSTINTIPVLRATTGISRQTGGIAVDGVVECGGVLTTQSSRQTPWVEPRVNCSTLTSFTTTTVADITGATVTFTPPKACRVMVVATFYLECVTLGGDFRGRLDIDGVEHSEQVRWQPSAAGDFVTVTGVFHKDLTAASHTIKLRGNLGTASGQIDVHATHTGFVLIGVGNG